MVNPVDDRTFDTEVLESALPVLVEFGASWCPPCRMIAPVLEDIAGERAGSIRVVSIDVDANPVTQARYGVMSLPTMLLFVRGTPVRQVIGFTSKGRLLAVLDETLAVAPA
ncbi:MAG: thioredoxin domain-containing protein [Candidatus Dormiibacterota bacterium]